jgi:hypothetical protein
MADDIKKMHISSNERIKWNKCVADLAAHVATTNRTAHPLASGGTNYGFSQNNYTTSEKDKLATVQANANYYIHPSTHPASMITGLHAVATSGNYNSLNNRPTSMPANGGNSATVGGIRFTCGSSAPSGPTNLKDVWFDSANLLVKIYNGGWKSLYAVYA